ncbi:MAG: citramalate synthase [Acidobacteria bacterium]|nr:MAG: citramalate synthase [Acidobacteriota bacterium]
MKVAIYDTTLRDGTQGEGVSFSVADKLAVARKLDELGVDYIEGGWPGSNPRDAEFFERARTLELNHARLAAFGSTCHPRSRAEDDANLKALLEAETPVVTIFGKTWDLHVTKALGTTLENNLELIVASIAHLKSKGREVIYDAEHFFDGFTANPDYALETLLAAERAAADWIVLCDTNGGTLTTRLAEVFALVKRGRAIPLGIHAHNDSELAVANSITAVERGATQVQGTINGYGERCGNANLCSVIPVLELKLGHEAIGRERLSLLTHTSRFVAELANIPHGNHLPFVGQSAFAHKGGIHVSAVMKDPATYEHIDPELTGNARRVLVSDLSGKSNILYKAAEMGVDFSTSAGKLETVVARIKELEHQGFQFEAAEASLRLLMESALGNYQSPFALGVYCVSTERDSMGVLKSEATVSADVRGELIEATAEGCGPVHALDVALRRVLSKAFECVGGIHLTDYKVRVLDSNRATGARVRVLIDTSDDNQSWRTVGVSDNILEASLQALEDAVNYKLLSEGGVCRNAPQLNEGFPEEAHVI